MIRARSILGEKYLEQPRFADAPLLKDGDTIEVSTPQTGIENRNSLGPCHGGDDALNAEETGAPRLKTTQSLLNILKDLEIILDKEQKPVLLCPTWSMKPEQPWTVFEMRRMKHGP